MIWHQIIGMFVVAIVFSSILAWFFGWRHPARHDQAGFAVFFLFVIMLAMLWGGHGIYRLSQHGTVGRSWVGMFLVGFFTALLILAISVPPRKPRPDVQLKGEDKPNPQKTAAILSLFFWIFILGLFVSGIVSLAAMG